MAMLASLKRRAGWKRKNKQSKETAYHTNPSTRAPLALPISTISPPPTPGFQSSAQTLPTATPRRLNHAHKQHHRISYAVPYPVAAEKNPSMRRRLTVYFKKDSSATAPPTVTVTALPTPPSSTESTPRLKTTNFSVPLRPKTSSFAQPLSPGSFGEQPWSPTYSTHSTQAILSPPSSPSAPIMPLKRQSASFKVPTRGVSVRMPSREKSVKGNVQRSKSFRKSTGDLLSVYTFLGGQETISADPKNRRQSRFYMSASSKYEGLASPDMPQVPEWTATR